jgi:hypothetical protein
MSKYWTLVSGVRQVLRCLKNKNGPLGLQVLPLRAIDAMVFNLRVRGPMESERKHIYDRLWNQSVSAACYEGAKEKYQAAILEQYKLYVEMADRISQRRGLTNTFFSDT